VAWRPLLLVTLVAAVALVLASKPTQQGVTGATTRSANPLTASGPATAASPDGPAALAPAASHGRADRAARLPRLVDLGADRCIPCKAMAPILVELRQEYAGRMQVDFIDVWKNPSAGDPYNIYSIPTQVFFDEHGRELTRHQGFLSREDILATWKRVGYDFSVPGPASPAS
jgi:thioredoxin 1